MVMSGQEHRDMYHRRHQAVTGPPSTPGVEGRNRLSSHPSDTPDEQSRVPPFLEAISKMWTQVQQCLAITVAVLYMMWQHFKALISLWCRLPCPGYFKNKRNLSVNAEVDILSYSSKKWKGEASNVTYMRKGYEDLYWKHNIKTLHYVKQDNYCVLRAVMFQVFSQGIPFPGWMRAKDILMLPGDLYSQGRNWIQQFSFGHEKYTGSLVFVKLRSCLVSFKNLWEAFYNCKDRVERNKLCKSVFSDKDTENKLYEALKFIMLYLVIDAYKKVRSEQHSPCFFHFLFSRDTSSDPLSYMMNHLNAVGDTSGLEQADLCLVGYALEVKIKLYRLSKMNAEDFEIYYPEDYKRTWHEICLMTDDEQYYNIPVKAI